MKIDYATPIFNSYPQYRMGMGMDWNIENPFDYSTLHWNVEGVEKPSQTELVEKFVEIYYDKEINEYKSKRGGEYLSFAEQFDQIYHKGVDAWKISIQEIKDKYPKTLFDSAELARRKAESLDFII